MYERDGQPLEVVARHIIESKFIRPKIRPYQTDNYYAILKRLAEAQKEVNQIVWKKQKKLQAGRNPHANRSYKGREKATKKNCGKSQNG